MDCLAEVKVKELGINLILGGHRELKVFEVKKTRTIRKAGNSTGYSVRLDHATPPLSSVG